MTGRFYIDGKDAFTYYGVFVSQGGYNELISFPALKSLYSVDFPEENGEHVDLFAPVLNYHEVSMQFTTVDKTKTDAFLALISTGVYHTYYFHEIGFSRSLRLVKNADRNAYTKSETFKLSLCEDHPMSGYVYSAPTGGGIPIINGLDFSIDGISLLSYGCYALKSDIKVQAPVKKNLLVDIKSVGGAIYDGNGNVVLDKKDLSINCWSRFDTTAEMWVNLNALIYNLLKTTSKTKDGITYSDAMRTIYSKEADKTYLCYYGSLTVTKFELLSKGRVWLEFTLKLELPWQQ